MATTTGPATAKNEPYIEIAQDASGWHWQLWAGNGRALARNAESYPDKKHCLQAVRLIEANWSKAKVIVAATPDEE